MQTINIDGTRYTLKFDRDPIEWAKKARRKWKPAALKANPRQFPTFVATMTTAQYLDRYQSLNASKHSLSRWEFHHANSDRAAMYDPTIPLFEVIDHADN